MPYAFPVSRCAARCLLVLLLLGGTAAADSMTPSPPAGVAPACQVMFDWIVADRIRFRQSSPQLRGASRLVLLRLAEFARDCPGTRIRITGHTDTEGGEAYNQGLSEERADAVAALLTEFGVDPERLQARGAGGREPIADNATAFGREKNRRIEFELLPGAEP